MVLRSMQENPNIIPFKSVLQTDRQTFISIDKAQYSIYSNRLHLASDPMQPNKNLCYY